MSIQITKNLLDILSREASRRDRDFYAGNFTETALIEHLFRYWLESALGADGFDEINREVSYETRKDGQRKACDLLAHKNNRRHWIELKVAYENTGYTHAELTADIERLSLTSKDDGRIYVAIFLAMSSDVPKKLQDIHAAAEGIGASVHHCSVNIAAPESWREWSDAHLHVTTCSW
jgi:hypothetical protein